MEQKNNHQQVSGEHCLLDWVPKEEAGYLWAEVEEALHLCLTERTDGWCLLEVGEGQFLWNAGGFHCPWLLEATLKSRLKVGLGSGRSGCQVAVELMSAWPTGVLLL